MSIRLSGLVALLALAGCSGDFDESVIAGEDPAQATIGERLFLETRFAQFQAASGSDVNTPLAVGDSTVAKLASFDNADRPGPFAGQAINCRQCHLVDEALDGDGRGMRSYADFAPRSPLPPRADRGDTEIVTPRNSPPLVNASLARTGATLFHFDGEFSSLEALTVATMLGRNYGWLPDERAAALTHVARVIREDDGRGELALGGGGSYRRVLAGTDPSIPVTLQLPPEFRVDVDSASDSEIVGAVARLIAAYVRQLEFTRDPDGVFNGSPYDLFLQINQLPQQPDFGESDLAYARRLRAALDDGRALKSVPSGTRTFQFHPDQPYAFGDAELQGLRIFLDDSRGNCLACHAPPAFTDFGLHNTGATQDEFDAVHGVDAFAALPIPSLAQRRTDPAPYLPATAAHPDYRGRFRAVPVIGDALATDLGAWLVFANPDVPATQAGLRERICASAPGIDCADDAAVLASAVAVFKTPGLRDLGHSAPYLHSGREASFADVMRFYQRTSDAARSGSLRNADPQLLAIQLQDADIEPLARFLDALNEDYN